MSERYQSNAIFLLVGSTQFMCQTDRQRIYNETFHFVLVINTVVDSKGGTQRGSSFDAWCLSWDMRHSKQQCSI